MGEPATTRFAAALARFDEANGEDPNVELDGGTPRPKELVYAERMTAWLDRFAPDASEALRLAARCQHLCRWRIPRRDYADGRAGYLAWRHACKELHASLAAPILADVGYDEVTVTRVQDLVRKRRLKLDPESQLLEDVACLVFLENYSADFATKHAEEKVVSVLRKTWKKMSPRGREMAVDLELPQSLRRLLDAVVA